MSVASISGSGGFDVSQMAAQLFKNADANSDGGIDKSEFKAMLARGPAAKNGGQNVDKIFAESDTNGDGKIDQTENLNAIKKMGGKGGSPPPGGANGSTASAASSASSAGKTYDKMDLNKDGTVSMQEKLLYALQHLDEGGGKQSGSTTSDDDKGIKSAIASFLSKMQSGTGYGSDGTLSTSTSGVSGLFSLSA
jgi:Ca2+-binding EF-hand superfamily protein